MEISSWCQVILDDFETGTNLTNLRKHTRVIYTKMKMSFIDERRSMKCMIATTKLNFGVMDFIIWKVNDCTFPRVISYC